MQGEARGDLCRSRGDRAEFYLFLLLLMSVPLAMGPYTAPEHLKWLILNTAAPILMGAWWFRRMKPQGIAVRVDAITWALLAGLATAIVSAFNATNPGLAAVSVSKGLGLFCVYFLAANTPANDRDRDLLLWALSGCGFLVALYGIAQHFGYDFYPWMENAELPARRAYSSVGHPTFAASLQVIVLPLTVALACTRETHLARLTAFAIAAAQLIHVQYTGARGPAIALAVASIVAVALILKNIGRTRLGVAAAILLLLGISAFVVARAWHEKESDPLAVKEGGVTLRLNTWETASRLFVAHPLLGVGVGNYAVVSPIAWNEQEALHFMRHNRLNGQVHNEYLQAAAEQGVPGLGALLLLVVFSLLQALHVVRTASSLHDRRIGLALLASLVAAYVDAFGLFTMRVASPALALWALLGAVTFMAHRERSRSPASDLRARAISAKLPQ